MKVILRALTIALVSTVLLGGCAGYGKNYQLYVEGCKDPGNQSSMSIPVAGATQPMKINQGCTLQAPADTQTALIQAGASLMGSFLNAGVQYVGIKESNETAQVQAQFNADVLKAGFGAAGNQFSAGGDIRYGDNGGTGNNEVTNPPPAAPAPTTPTEPAPAE